MNRRAPAAAAAAALVVATLCFTGWAGAAGAADAPNEIALTVVDAATGSPVAGAAVAVRAYERDKPVPPTPLGEMSDVPSHTYTTDAQGRLALSLTNLRRDWIRLVVTKAGYARRDISWKGEADGRHLPAAHAIKLDPGHVIGGVVADEAGRGIEGASVGALTYFADGYNDRFGEYTNLRTTVTTDAQGRWEIPNAPADLSHVLFEVKHPDHLDGRFGGQSVREKLLARAAETVLPRGVRVAGRVTDAAGKPVAGATVLWDVARGHDYPSTTTDADGRYRTNPVRPGAVKLYVQRDGLGLAPALREIDAGAAGADGRLNNIDFTLGPARVFEGRVVDTAGKPLEGVIFIVRGFGKHELMVWQKQKTGADGRFRYEGPDDALTLEVVHKGHLRLFQYRLTPQEQPYTLALRKAPTVAGAVTDAATGEPVKRFRVVPGVGFPNGQMHWDDGDAEPGYDGRYAIGFDMPRDSYYVRIEADGYQPAKSGAITFGAADEGKPFTFDAKLVKGNGEGL